MSDLIWLSEAQMRRIEPHFPLSHGVPRVTRPAGDLGDHLRDPQRVALARCAQGLRAAQDHLQPLHPVEPHGRVQQDICGTCGQGRQARSVDDRCDPPQGAPDGCQPFKKGII